MATKIHPFTILDQQATRKPSDWSDVTLASDLSEARKKYLRNKLETFESDDSYGPMRTIVVRSWNPTEPFPQRFVVRHKDKAYYVNTEGYSYCRYALEIPADIVKDNKSYHSIGTTDVVSPYEVVKEYVEEIRIPKNLKPEDYIAPTPPQFTDEQKASRKRLRLSAEVLVGFLNLTSKDDTTLALAKEVEYAINEYLLYHNSER
jgi:hypothetical protein